jgi:hypothetical protein
MYFWFLYVFLFNVFCIYYCCCVCKSMPNLTTWLLNMYKNFAYGVYAVKFTLIFRKMLYLYVCNFFFIRRVCIYSWLINLDGYRLRGNACDTYDFRTSSFCIRQTYNGYT